MTTKMKGLLKGLRYISQIFDNEKEPEMMIGHPTDVKHVAHIGWDGPSVTSSSWMNEFKSSPQHSAPLDAIDKFIFKDDPSNLHATEGSSRGGARSPSCQSSPARESPDLPKSTRQHSSTGASSDSPTKAKSERVKPPRRSSKSGKDEVDSSKQQPEDRIGDVDSPTRRQLPDVPKKSRRKKSKDSGGGSTRSSSRSKTKASSSESPYLDPAVGDGMISRMEGVEEEEEEKKIRGPSTTNQHVSLQTPILQSESPLAKFIN